MVLSFVSLQNSGAVFSGSHNNTVYIPAPLDVERNQIKSNEMDGEQKNGEWLTNPAPNQTASDIWWGWFFWNPIYLIKPVGPPNMPQAR